MEDVPVIEIGTDYDIIGCASNRTIESALLILGINKFRRLPITKLGKIEGILTITDIFGIIAKVGIHKAFDETISDWMTASPKTIDLNTSAKKAVKMMGELKIGSLLLVDAENPEICKGIITERDILYHYNSTKWRDIQLKDLDKKYTSFGYEIIEYSTSLEDAIKIMSEKRTHRLIVKTKTGEGLYGILSANDITKLITTEREEINNNTNFLTSVTAGYVSSGKLMTINEDTTLQLAIEYMREQKFGALPIIGSDGNVTGLISERSLIFIIADEEL